MNIGNGHTPDAPAAGPAGVYRYRFANVEYDEAQNLLSVAGQQIDVERLPLQLLAVLLGRPDEVVTRAELFEALWQGRPTVENVLANAVSKLRRALGEEAGQRLVNLPRVGYRLTGPIERVAVGRRHVRTPGLQEGQPVPGRGDFVLLRQLGDAAASTVWLARHKRLHQTRVFKFASDGNQLSALKREFTACRLLLEELGRRPDLVEVQESNFSDAPYFLAYEDAGVDLRAWADEQPHLSAMGLTERVAMFLKIAHAVAAAHSVGVLHRDLKPRNVLVSEWMQHPAIGAIEGLAQGSAAARWQVRLTDFGSSHLLAPERLAALGVTAMGLTITDSSHPLLGSTPHYLAPELLAGGSSSMRSDVYALGLILYQLLAGDLGRPLATGWEHEIADPLLVDDVRAATEGRPERRLASVAQLIERLESLDQRRMQGELAAEASQRLQVAADRLKKIRSRRPWLVALTACIALGGLGATWFGVQARAAQRQAERATTRAQSISDFLNMDVLQSADVMRVAATRRVSMIDVLARASDRAGERFKTDPLVLAQVRRQLGDIYLRMYFTDHAEYQYQRAITVLEPWVSADDSELLAARFGLAQALTARDRPREARAKLEIAERAAGPELLAGSTGLAQRALRARVQVLMDGQHYQEALPFAMRLLQLSDEPSEGLEVELSHRFEARQWLYEIYFQLDDRDHAAALLKEITSPPFGDRNVGEVSFARAKLQLGREYIRQSRFDEAERLLTNVRDTLEHAFGAQELHVGMTNSALFDVYWNRGRFQEALQSSEFALNAFNAVLGEQHRLVTIARINIALCELNLERPADALPHLEAARARLDANGRHAGQVMAIDLGRARALTSLGRSGEALELLQALTGREHQGGDSPAPEAALELQAEMGRALMASGQLGRGRAMVNEALNGMRQAQSLPWKLTRYQVLLARGSVSEPKR